MEIIYANENNYENLIKNGNVLVDFYADWCGPCKMLELELEQIKNKIQIIKVNIDENIELCKMYGVLSVPTLIYFKTKDEFLVKIGYVTADDLTKWIDE